MPAPATLAEAPIAGPYVVEPGGMIKLGNAYGSVKVAGMSTSEASAEIIKALLKVMVTPQVTVLFVERAKMQVFVVGQVLTDISYSLVDPRVRLS